MRPFTSSIRRHLLCWLLAPIMSLCAIGAFITYIIAVGFATEAYDAALLDEAHSISNQLDFGTTIPTIDLPPAALAILKHGDKDAFLYQVLSSKGELISGEKVLPAPPQGEDSDDEPLFYDGIQNNRELRLVEVQVPKPDKSGHIVLRAAETTNGRTELIQSILLGVVLPQLLLIISAAILVWLGVARGLKPLAKVKEAVESRNPSDLRLIDVDQTPKEVKPVVIAINQLLLRLQEDREAQRRFVSNAAHQLRTPLAGLKTQTELALRNRSSDELRHSLQQINTSADRATRLAQQLLTLAKLEPCVFNNVKKEAVDLNKIAREASGELVPIALAKDIDLGFESSNVPQIIHGDAGSLYELSYNLIENAILYTQAGGKVTVKVMPQPGATGPYLAVEDNGPGIPEEEQKQVFERFYRILGNKVQGSGLGLAIVREIAEAHNASVKLSTGADGKGTIVTVHFQELDFTPQAIESAVALPV